MTAFRASDETYSGPYDKLVALYDQLAHLAAEHRMLCAATSPDSRALSMTRWRIAETSRCRMEMLSETVFPLLERVCGEPDLTAVRALRRSTAAYRSRVSVYVSRWSTAAIVADWRTYQRDSGTFRADVAERILLERRLLLPLLSGLKCAERRASRQREAGAAR